MSQERKRKLAAIMFTDMVGYSALTQENENLALNLLEEHRQILRPLFPKHGGHEVETAGDAFFVEFSSALEAVHCAIDIQKVLWERNNSVAKEKQIKIRIGIHLGDVVHKGKNVLGDGVNIAARIEPLAQSCGICVSEDVARQVQNKIEYPLKKIETKQLKNIKLPVAVYSVTLTWLQDRPDPNLQIKRTNQPVYIALIIAFVLIVLAGLTYQNWINPEISDISGGREWENSIAVLPFTDMSAQKDQEYFCDGMTEQILTNLAKLGRLKVIARTSVMKFKNTQKTIPEIGRELQVDNILEGSIRKFGNRLRVTAQLVKSVDGSHIWAEDYDSEMTDLFAIQDDISRSIAGELAEKLTESDSLAITTHQTINLEAYELFLKAEYLHHTKYWSSEAWHDFQASEQLFLRAIELDPGYAASYAGLADLYNTYWNSHAEGPDEKQKYLELQEEYIQKAYELDSLSAEVNRVMGWVFAAKGEMDLEFQHMTRAVELDANDPENLRALGIFYDVSGLKHQAFRCYDRCVQLDPYSAKYYYYRGNVHYSLGKVDSALNDLAQAVKLDPDDRRSFLLYTTLLYQLDKKSAAGEATREFKSRFPDSSGGKFLEALELATRGKKDNALAIDLEPDYKIILYLILKMNDEVFEANKQAHEQNMSEKRSKYLILKHHPMNDFLRTDPRFQHELERNKLLYEQNLKDYGHGIDVLNSSAGS